MRKPKKYLLPIAGLVVLLSSLVVGCSQEEVISLDQRPFLTYTNEDWGYSINYPGNWEVDAIGATETYLLAPKPYSGFINISIVANPNLTPEQAATGWFMAITDTYNDPSLLANIKMETWWDWYTGYDYISRAGEEFRGEAYFKQAESNLYKINMEGEREVFEDYPFDEIISTFRFLLE